MSDFVLMAFGPLAAAAIVAGVRLHRPPQPLPWYLIAAATACFGGADVLYQFDDLQLTADLVYCAGYPFLLAGVVRLVRSRGDGLGAIVDAAVGAAAIGALQTVLVIAPHASGGTVARGEAFALGYPVFDVLLLLVLVRAGRDGRRFPAFRLLVAGFVVMFLADEGFALFYETHADSIVWRLLWTLDYVLMAAAALHPSMVSLTASGPSRQPELAGARLTLLTAGLLVPLALIVVLELMHGHPLTLAIAVGEIPAALLVLLLIAGMLRESEQLRLAERRARAEAEATRAGLLAQNHRLQSLDRMKDGVIASVSHEFRSPLTSIRGHLRLVSQQVGPDLSERHRRSLEVIERSSARLARMVEDVLTVARLRAGQVDLEVGRCDVTAVAGLCVDAARPSAEARELELRLTAEPVTVMGDETRVGQVIDNLLSNAIKFSDPGGAIDVRVTRGAGIVSVEVQDRGVGISPADRVQLFQPFGRGATASARQTPGTGLGLHISESIVRAHGGTIGLDSTFGTGTTARFELPLAGPPLTDTEVAA